MDKNWKDIVQYGSAVALLLSGVGLSIAGFVTPPAGEISDSVLWYFAQCLIYAGSVFGISLYAQQKVGEMRRELLNQIKNENSK